MSKRNMNKTILVVFVIMAVFGGCKKDKWPEPDFILQYTTPQGNYNQISEYRSNKNEAYQLIPSVTTTWPATFTDTVLISYTSTLADKNGKPVVSFTFSKKFPVNALNFSTTGKPTPKDPNDFYNIFKPGVVDISSVTPSDNRSEGIDATFSDSSASYIFQENAGFNVHPNPLAYQDTANYFEITQANADIDFLSVSTLLGEISMATMVKIKFRCKMYSINNPHPTLSITNGTFQGIFIHQP